MSKISSELRAILACPRDHGALVTEGTELVCAHGHRYPIVDGVPVFLVEEARATHPIAEATLARARRGGAEAEAKSGAHPSDPDDRAAPPVGGDGRVDPYVQREIMNTNGTMYRSRIGALTNYPIPQLRLPPGRGERLLDLGCNWGRWCYAAWRAGYSPVGIDPSLDAVQAACRVAAQLGTRADFMVADARFLPFSPDSFDVVFSYSVLQHFSKDNVRSALGEVRRVLVPGGRAMIQMANALGIRSLYHQARRGFREGRDFDVRYWTPGELKRTFDEIIGPAELSIDGFFSLNPQPAEAHLLPLHFRGLTRTSEALRAVGARVPLLGRFADSLYIDASRAGSGRLS